MFREKVWPHPIFKQDEQHQQEQGNRRSSTKQRQFDDFIPFLEEACHGGELKNIPKASPTIFCSNEHGVGEKIPPPH